MTRRSDVAMLGVDWRSLGRVAGTQMSTRHESRRRRRSTRCDDTSSGPSFVDTTTQTLDSSNPRPRAQHAVHDDDHITIIKRHRETHRIWFATFCYSTPTCRECRQSSTHDSRDERTRLAATCDSSISRSNCRRSSRRVDTQRDRRFDDMLMLAERARASRTDDDDQNFKVLGERSTLVHEHAHDIGTHH